MVDFSEVKNELWKLRLSPQFPIQEKRRRDQNCYEDLNANGNIM